MSVWDRSLSRGSGAMEVECSMSVGGNGLTVAYEWIRLSPEGFHPISSDRRSPGEERTNGGVGGKPDEEINRVQEND